MQSLHVVAFQRENKRCTMVHQVLTVQTAASDLYKMNYGEIKTLSKNGKVCAELHNNDLPLMNSLSRFSSGKMWNTKVVDGLTF